MNNAKFQKQRGAAGTHPADVGRVGPIQVDHSGRAEDGVNARSQTAEARGMLHVDRGSEGKEGDGGGEATEVAIAAGPGGEASAVAATRPRREGGGMATEEVTGTGAGAGTVSRTERDQL